MKKIVLLLATAFLTMLACKKNDADPTVITTTESTGLHSKDGVQDSSSAPDILKIASGNKDFTTLVKAVQTAGLTTSLSNAGPFTVFAPTNEAFDKLDPGVLKDLMNPENAGKLADILGHHTYVGVIKEDQFTDGQQLGMVDGTKITITLEEGKPVINGDINITATVPASNGIIYVVDSVILPQ